MRRTALRSVASSSITRIRATGTVIVQLSRAVSDLAPPRELGDVLARTVGPGLDRRGGLAPAARDGGRAVRDAAGSHVVLTVVAAHHRHARAVAHAARAQEGGREDRLLHQPAARAAP